MLLLSSKSATRLADSTILSMQRRRAKGLRVTHMCVFAEFDEQANAQIRFGKRSTRLFPLKLLRGFIEIEEITRAHVHTYVHVLLCFSSLLQLRSRVDGVMSLSTHASANSEFTPLRVSCPLFAKRIKRYSDSVCVCCAVKLCPSL
jgi:hypothetical protein